MYIMWHYLAHITLSCYSDNLILWSAFVSFQEYSRLGVGLGIFVSILKAINISAIAFLACAASIFVKFALTKLHTALYHLAVNFVPIANFNWVLLVQQGNLKL